MPYLGHLADPLQGLLCRVVEPFACFEVVLGDVEGEFVQVTVGPRTNDDLGDHPGFSWLSLSLAASPRRLRSQ